MKMSHNLGLYWAKARPVRLRRSGVLAYPSTGLVNHYQRGRRHWPVGAQYMHGPSGHELTIFHPEINELIVQDVKIR